jgi:beta-lactamase superfamily II metal-dependent hydrolase
MKKRAPSKMATKPKVKRRAKPKGKTQSKAKPESKPKKPQASAKGDVHVRMYDVGFGDCFLVTFNSGDQARRVLFDCGSLKVGQRPIPDVVAQVIADVTDPDGKARIDVVVATHRHKDHVSGFEAPSWSDVEVGEVWMPWTEHPSDPRAAQVRSFQMRLAEVLTARAALALQAELSAAERSHMELVQELAANALSNQRAMQMLQHGFAGNPKRRYLPTAGVDAAWFETAVLPGATIYVLGPSRSEEALREMEPPIGQSYLKLADSAAETDAAPWPFRPDWRVDDARYHGEYPSLAEVLAQDDRGAVRGAGQEGLDQAAATATDSALNATSLMLVLRIGRASLLFPGDAQWGTWKRALANTEFRDLLSETDFYKIGHHGSANATPVEFVEEVLGDTFLAMASVNPTSRWPLIPKAELLKALKGKAHGRVARSDRPGEAGAGFAKGADGSLEVTVGV